MSISNYNSTLTHLLHRRASPRKHYRSKLNLDLEGIVQEPPKPNIIKSHRLMSSGGGREHFQTNGAP